MTIADVETDRLNRLHSLAPPNRGDLNSTHVHGAHAPVEEPSTASEADMRRCSSATRAWEVESPGPPKWVEWHTLLLKLSRSRSCEQVSRFLASH